MTEVVIETESPVESTESTAEEIAEAIVEAQEEVRGELEQEAAVEAAVETSEIALESVFTHEHAEYALIGHSHPELDVSERMSALEGRLSSLELSLESAVEETEEAETIEPTQETSSNPEPERKRTGFRRGRA